MVFNQNKNSVFASLRLCVSIILFSLSFAQFVPSLGGERAGTAAGTFLKIGVGARASALGGAIISEVDDATALYWNPAGMSNISGTNIHLSHIEYVADIGHEFIGAVRQLSPYDWIGASIIALHTDPMKVTTEVQPNGTGQTFRYSDFAAGLSYSRQLTDRFAAGMTVRFMQENLATVAMRNVLFDIGTVYDVGYLDSKFSINVSNFGNSMKPTGDLWDYLGNPKTDIDFQEFSPPIIFRFGISGKIWKVGDISTVGFFQLNHPNDNAENYTFATEMDWRKIVFFRAGYRINRDVDNFSTGFGITLDNLKIDVSYSPYQYLGGVSRISLGMDL